MLDELRRAGRDLFVRGLVSTRGGNMSIRTGDTITVTRAGAMLGRLREGDFVDVPVNGQGTSEGEASSDTAIHRAIYQRSHARAVVHAHPTSVVVLSFAQEEIVPVDNEGKVFVPRVPVVPERDAVADAVASGARIVVLRGHGTYAAARTVEDAESWTTTLEMSAAILIGLR